MNKETENQESKDQCNIDSVSDSVFKIAVATPYTVEDITDLMIVSGIKIRDMETLSIQLNNCGVSDLRDVIVLAKLGYFNYC